MKKLFKVFLISFSVLLFTGCYHSDYQKSVAEEFPEAKVFDVDTDRESYVVITKDSLVYFVSSYRIFSTKPSNKQLLFNLKTPLK